MVLVIPDYRQGSVTGSEAVTNTMRALSIVSGVETSEYGGSEITTAMTGSIPASSSSAAPGHVYGGPGLFGGPALFGGPTGSSAVMTDTASVSSRQPPRRGPIQEFNAWDPSGTLHRVSKAQTVVSETHTATTSKTIRSNGWAKPVCLTVQKRTSCPQYLLSCVGQPQVSSRAPVVPQGRQDCNCHGDRRRASDTLDGLPATPQRRWRERR